MDYSRPNGIMFSIREETNDETFVKPCMFEWLYKNKTANAIPLELLREYVTEYNFNRQTPLMYAALIGNVNLVRELIRYDVGKVDDFGLCALDYAKDPNVCALLSEFELCPFYT